MGSFRSSLLENKLKQKRGFVKIWGTRRIDSHAWSCVELVGDVDIKPAGNRMTKNVGPVAKPGEGDPDECFLNLRMLSNYLLAKDSDKCGVAKITFTGIYRRTN